MLSRKLDGYSSVVAYGEDGRVPYSAVTGCGSDGNTDIATLSDFSEDSAETGVRRLSDYQVPVPVQPIVVAEDVIPIPRDPPVDDTYRAIPESEVELSYIPGLPIKSSLLQWDRGVLPGLENREEFMRCAGRMLSEALARDEDPVLDKAYPEFIQCMVKCKRILKKIWGEHNARLEEQGTVCTTPGCQCFQYLRRGWRRMTRSRRKSLTGMSSHAGWGVLTVSQKMWSLGLIRTPPPPPCRGNAAGSMQV